MPETEYELIRRLYLEAMEGKGEELKNLTPAIEEQAKFDALEYLDNRTIDIRTMHPHACYHIISKLSEEEQIKFIKENIDYIKEHDEVIFMYNYLSPSSLSYYFSLEVLKEIKELDLGILKKIINGPSESLCHGFTADDYIEFFTEFYDEIIEMKNCHFSHVLEMSRRVYIDNIEIHDINTQLELQEKYNKEFLYFILEKYSDKISTFNPNDLLYFIYHIDDIEEYKKFVKINYEKLTIAFRDISDYDLFDTLELNSGTKQEVLINTFCDYIIKNRDIKSMITYLEHNIIINLYNQDKAIFNSMSLSDWIIYCSNARVFNKDFQKIIDSFDVKDIENIINLESFKFGDTRALIYIENKYRNSMKITGNLESIDENISIFSQKYLKNLKELREMFNNNTISRSSLEYKKHLMNFILFLKKRKIISDISDDEFREVEKLFYRIVMGFPLSSILTLSSILEITILNRLGRVEFKVSDFTIQQLQNYNVKHHKALYQQIETNKGYIIQYKNLILKLLFLVGYNHAKVLLDLDNSISTLEHLVGNVDIKNVVLDENGNPILNHKIMNLLFSDKNYSRIKAMLSNKESDLYKYFPRIFNEWEIIKMNNKANSLETIIEFMKSDEILLPPKYYRLNGLFKYIGCNSKIVAETLSLHDQMLKRTGTTIPKIKGMKSEYSYEVLDLNDMEGLAVGNKTNCCFTVLGNAYSCLKHAVTSNNGRILVIKKNGIIVAHSWLWRNGDLLCLDNIEVSKTIQEVDFLDVYLQFANEMISESFSKEGVDGCIKNITIGVTNFDKKINGIEKYPCIIAKSCDLEVKGFHKRLGGKRRYVDVLPQPLEDIEYSDSKNVQYLIKGTGNFKLGQSIYLYPNERNKVLHYNSNSCYDNDYLSIMEKKINCLRYMKYEEDNIDLYHNIKVSDLSEAYFNDDWYIITYNNGTVEKYVNSQDERVYQELTLVETDKIKKCKCLL